MIRMISDKKLLINFIQGHISYRSETYSLENCRKWISMGHKMIDGNFEKKKENSYFL